MSRIEDLTEYFGTVRRGYNRAHFADRVKELSILVDAAPLAPDDFNALFKIWLALRIPIKTWSNIGSCLIPAGPVDDDLIGYAARWCLSGLYAEMSPSRLGFVLNWLTAALDHNLVSAKAMDGCYGAFQIVFQYERYSTYAAKLMYKLTKPHDVCRFWTLSLLNLLTQRNAARDRAQITALLGLYKSYKPECVPESVPAISVHSAFPKINATLLNRFRRVQNHRNTVDTSGHLSWRNNLRAMGKLGKGKAPPLIPDLEFIQFGSQLYSDSGEKNYLHFNDAESVLAHALQRRTRRPAQLLSLLCNDTGAALLSTMPAEQHTFLSHELKHQLDACFLQDDRLYRREEKADLLRRLGRFQQLLLQPVPVVSDFLVKYLVFWNGCDYFEEVLRLCEWVQLGSWAALRARVLAPLRLLYLTVAPPARRAILRTFSALYSDYLVTSPLVHAQVLRLCEWVQLGSWAALRARVLAPLRLLYLTVAPPARRAILRTFSALYSDYSVTSPLVHAQVLRLCEWVQLGSWAALRARVLAPLRLLYLTVAPPARRAILRTFSALYSDYSVTSPLVHAQVLRLCEWVQLGSWAALRARVLAPLRLLYLTVAPPARRAILRTFSAFYSDYSVTSPLVHAQVLRLCEWVQLGSWAALRARVLAPLRLLYLTVAPPARRAILRTFSAFYSDYSVTSPLVHAQVLRLCEWVQLGSWAALRARVLAPLRLLYLTVAPPARRAILRTFSALYSDYLVTSPLVHAQVLRLCEWVQLGSWAALRARVLAPLRLLYLTVAPPARRAILRTFSALYSDYLVTSPLVHAQVLRLCEWVQLGSWAALRARVLAPLRLLYLTVAPPARRAILRTFSALYSNLAYTRTKQHNLFLDSPPERDLEETLSGLAGFLQDLCTQSLRIYPVDAENLSSCLRTCEELTQAELTHGAPHCSVAPPLVAGLALASPSAHALNSLAGLLLRERKVFARLRRQTGGGGLRAQEHRLLGYRGALAACLWRERALTERADGPLLGGMPQARVDRLIERFPRADRTFGLARHPALAPYTYGPSDHVHARTVSRDAVLAGVVAPMFPELARLVEKLADKDA